jgi:hypothetical protein
VVRSDRYRLSAIGYRLWGSAARPTPEPVREAQQLAALAAHRGDLPPDDGFAPALMPTMF